jgi:hypothetical protein
MTPLLRREKKDSAERVADSVSFPFLPYADQLPSRREDFVMARPTKSDKEGFDE